MVVAEVPLWVVHSSNQPETAAFKASGSLSAAAASDTAARAQQSLALVQHRSNKCAIYSLDVHPHKALLATAGGDGKVRLWNTAALFTPKHKGGSYTAAGSYVSTSAGSDNDDDDEQRNGGYSSVGVDQDDDGANVHDLNNVVRRKKDGSAPTRQKSAAPKRPLSAEAGASPSRGHRSSSKHHRLVGTLSAHTGSSVLAVRFSPSGKFLASGGDDAVVCIYAPSSNSHTAVGNLSGAAAVNGHTEHQQWSRIKLCRGHALDVLDLAWAPDDSHLVSCSLDSATPVIVWKLSDLLDQHRSSKSMICNPYRVLGKDIHKSTVKGVAFDPAGSYLASSGDDPAVCIWRAHDDWGLETRIDSTSGIFRTWKTTNSNDNEDGQALSANQSMFRRLSWSTDGAFVCATNAVVKNKHVASTISRDGWSVSSADNRAAVGAANLVGHKQPIVCSRHAAQLLDARRNKRGSSDSNAMAVNEDDDDEPESATLLALGDRRGFVTVWSTRKSRPLFKLQCSESRCTVTDLAWGRIPDSQSNGNINNKSNVGDMMLLVSLLDGQVVALRFGVPDEMGPFLSKRDHGRVFQLRYGIDVDDDDGTGHRRLLVGQTTGGTRLIESALQMSLEDDANDDNGGDALVDNSEKPFMLEDDDDEDEKGDRLSTTAKANELTARPISEQQQESRLQGGKKRIRPVLMKVDGSDKRPRERPVAKNVDPMQVALQAAEKTSVATEAATAGTSKRTDATVPEPPSSASKDDGHARPKTQQQPHEASVVAAASIRIPHDTDRVKSVDLALPETHVKDPNEEEIVHFAECANSIKVPTGSQGTPIPCIDIVIKRNNRITWRDQIPGTWCSAIAASRSMLAVGTTDGCLQLFGNSPTVGWIAGFSFRSHPPLVFGSTIVRLKLECDPTEGSTDLLQLLVVTADAAFGVYNILPTLSLQYKGSILPAMTHMALSTSSISGDDSILPKLSRIQITQSGRLLLLLSSSIHDANERNGPLIGKKPQSGVGGSLQAFVYDRSSELWLRVSDSRFALSDFYSNLPSSKTAAVRGPLSQMEDAVKLGSLQSPLESSHRNRYESDAIYNTCAQEQTGNYVASRAHCEDRMACAVALESSAEFKLWLSRYVRTLAATGNASQLRMLVDMLLGSSRTNSLSANHESEALAPCWWLSSTPELLQLDRKSLVRHVISEMSKNRSMQRVTNELALELENL